MAVERGSRHAAKSPAGVAKPLRDRVIRPTIGAMTEDADAQHRRVTRVPDVAISLIRTWVPMAAGGVLAWLASSQGWVLSADASITVGIAAASACAALYYGIARAAEATHGVGRVAGVVRGLGRWMLGGLVTKPVYVSEAEYARLLAAIKATPPL